MLKSLSTQVYVDDRTTVNEGHLSQPVAKRQQQQESYHCYLQHRQQQQQLYHPQQQQLYHPQQQQQLYHPQQQQQLYHPQQQQLYHPQQQQLYHPQQQQLYHPQQQQLYHPQQQQQLYHPQQQQMCRNNQQQEGMVVKEGEGGGELNQLLRQLQEEKTRLIQHLEEVKVRQRCVVCLDADLGVTFLPCAHLVTCTTCAATLAICPICRASIHHLVPVSID